MKGKNGEDAVVVAVEPNLHTGGCLCRAVRYETRGLADIWFCHCRQCRHLSGHYVAAAAVRREDLKIDGPLKWASFSATAEYAFCPSCGSPIFWRQFNAPTVSVFAGSLDDADGLAVKGHMFVKEKGDYYDIADDLPQFEGRPQGAGIRNQLWAHGADNSIRENEEQSNA